MVGLARAGAADEARIDEELERDRTISGPGERRSGPGLAPRRRRQGARPGPTWSRNPDAPNETHRSIAASFMRHGQEDLLEPYVEKYLEAADDIWERLGTHMASNTLEGAFPLPLGSPALVERLDRWLEESPANPAAKRYVREGRADVVRALAAQAQRRPGLTPRTLTRQNFTPSTLSRREQRGSAFQRVTTAGQRRSDLGVEGAGGAGLHREHADPAAQSADQVARGELGAHLEHGQRDLVVGEHAAYLAAGDDLEQAGRRVDHDQDAARRRRQRGVQPLGELARVALGCADEDRELEPGDLLGRPDRLVQGDALGRR